MRPRPFNCQDEATVTWRERALVAADLMKALGGSSSATFSVADIGCGDRKLRNAIQSVGLRCEYHGYDLLPQHDEVQCFDIRCSPVPPSHDVIVMLGIIEYLEDIEGILKDVAKQAPFLIVSHVIRLDDRYDAIRLAELGWRNHMDRDELTNLLSRSGFAIVDARMTPDGRTLIVAARSLRHRPVSSRSRSR